MKLDPKYGVIVPTVEICKLNKYKFESGTESENEFEFDQSDDYYSILSARIDKIDDLQIDINITGGTGSKSFNVAGRIDSKSCFETRDHPFYIL